MRRICKKAFGEYIRDKRQERGYTQEELANMLHTSSFTVSKWENGKRYPDFEMLDALADVLEVSIEDIYENSKTEIMEGFNISIGMIVLSIILVGACAGGVFKATRSVNEDDVKQNEDIEMENEYNLVFGLYISHAENTLSPYIQISEKKIMVGGSIWESYAQFYSYEVKNNKIHIIDFDESSFVLPNSESGGDIIYIRDGYLEYGGIKYYPEEMVNLPE